MARNLSVLLLSQSSTRLNALEDTLDDHQGLSATRKLMTANVRDPLTGLSATPDLILLDLSDDWEADLKSVSEDLSLSAKPPIIVIGPGDQGVMRKAMQAGARDYFSSPISEDELIASLKVIGRDAQQAQRSNSGTITAVINGKGGAGATLLASSLATMVTSRNKANPESTIIVDFDMQFGDTSVYFDLESDDHLSQALTNVDSLDRVAFDGLVQTHDSGVQILANKPEQVRQFADVNPADISKFLNSLGRYYDHIILDLPRTLDSSVIAALESSDLILVVTQQSVPHVRDTKYLLGLLAELGISNRAIRLVVNRFDKKGPIKFNDLKDIFQEVEIYQVPNDHKHVTYAVNNGVPVPVKWPKIPISKSMLKITQAIWPEKAPNLKESGKSFFSR